jgi:hypothetical protein
MPESDLVAEALKFMNCQIVAEDFEQMIAGSAHMQTEPPIEVKAEAPFEWQHKVPVRFRRKGHGKIVCPRKITRNGKMFFFPAEIKVGDQLIGDDTQKLADELRLFLHGDEELGLPHHISRNAERTVGGMRQRWISAGIKHLTSEETHGIAFCDIHHCPAVRDLAGIDSGMNEIHCLQTPEICIRFHPPIPHPGDIVIRKHDVTSETSGFEGVLKIRPGTHPRTGDAVRISPDVFKKPLLRKELSTKHGFRIVVIVQETYACLRDQKPVGDCRDNRDPIRPLEVFRMFDAFSPGGDVFSGDADFDDLWHLRPLRLRTSKVKGQHYQAS